MKVLILKDYDGEWEGLFINGNLIDEGHKLGEGSNMLYLLEKAEEYNFKVADVKIECVTQEDDKYLMKYGSFPSTLEELTGEYYD